MRRRLKELALSVGAGWFAVMIGVGLGVYGAVALIASSKASGWMWIAIGLFVMLGVALRVAYLALKARDDARGGYEGSMASTVIQGGEHYHYYGGPPNPEKESSGPRSGGRDGPGVEGDGDEDPAPITQGS